MKKLTLLFAAFLFLASCTSVEKLVERGEYNEAVLLAIRKLSGKKNKKTKHVQGLEDAFKKINDRDLRQAKRLIDSKDASVNHELHDIYSAIDQRQEAIRPLLPLVSKDGYRARFTFINVDGLLQEAAEGAAAFDYNRGKDMLRLAEKGDKDAAREAYHLFDATNQYFANYRDTRELKREAHFLGTTRVLIQMDNQSYAFLPAGFEREVMNIHVKDLNSKWIEYYTNISPNIPIDVRAVLEIKDIDISPEREVINHYVDEKTVKDGWKYVYDDNGNVMKDSLGNDIKEDKLKRVKAHITEIVRTKAAVVSGNVYYYDEHSGDRFRSNRVNVEAVFEDIACRVDGDRRAVNDSRRQHVKNYPLPFPTDFALTMQAAENLKEALKSEIDRSII